MSLANGDGGEAIQEPAHDLKTRLRRGVGAARDDDRPVAGSARKPCAANPLRQTADEADGGGRSERGPVVVVDLVPQTGITDLIEAHELIETERAAVWHQQTMKGHRESRLAEGLNGSRLAEDACARGNQHMLSAVGEHGFVTRQLTGDVPLPSSLLVRTVSMTVPSRSGCNGPAALIGLVRSGVRSSRWAEAAPRHAGPRRHWRRPRRAYRSLVAAACSPDNGFRDFVERRRQVVARHLHLATNPVGRPASGRSASGRRLRTTLLANRLSYSRRLRSASIGSSGQGRRVPPRGRCGSGWLRWLWPPALAAPPSLEDAPDSHAADPGSEHGRGLRLCRTPRRLGLTSDQDDQQNSERQARHQPGLESTRQHTARDRPMVADWRSRR